MRTKSLKSIKRSEVEFPLQLRNLVMPFKHFPHLFFSVLVQVVNCLLRDRVDTDWRILIQILYHSRVDTSTFNDLFLTLLNFASEIDWQHDEAQDSKCNEDVVEAEFATFNLGHDWVFFEIFAVFFHALLSLLEELGVFFCRIFEGALESRVFQMFVELGLKVLFGVISGSCGFGSAFAFEEFRERHGLKFIKFLVNDFATEFK